MSYRNDQLSNLYKASSGENIVYTSDQQNQSFAYPERSIRVAYSKPYAPLTGEHIVTTQEPYKRLELKRGYIRSIELPDSGSLGRGYSNRRKLNFQFNPQVLTQSVSQNTTVLNFMQQSPSDYARPMPGTVTTGFDLFFDRSKEINEFRTSDESFIDLASESPWEELGPSVIGVLHDLSMLFNIIGVGVSQKKKDDIIAGLTAEAIADVLAGDATDEEGENTRSEAEQAADAKSQVESFVGLNVGNTAFLLPLPVRIVFSSLYIVEGFVKDVSVIFTKFTHSMVPMQCTVSVSFEAKYIGFAKQDTYLTSSLSAALAQEPSTVIDQQTDISEDHLNILNQDLGRIMVAAVSGDGESEWGSNSYVWDADNNGVKRMISRVDAGRDRIIEDTDKFLKAVLFDAGVINRILAGTGTQMNISFNGTNIEVWRFTQDFFTENSALFSAVQSARTSQTGSIRTNHMNDFNADERVRQKMRAVFSKMSDVWRNSDINNLNLSSVDDSDGESRNYHKVSKIISMTMSDDKRYVSEEDEWEGYVTASTLQEWNDMVRGRCVAGKFLDTVTRDAYRDRDVSGWDGDGHIADISQFYYAAVFTLKVSVSIDGQGPYVKEIIDYALPLDGSAFGDDLFLRKTFTVEWSNPAPERDFIGPVLPPDPNFVVI